MTPIISGLAKQNGLKKIKDIYGKNLCHKFFKVIIFFRQSMGTQNGNFTKDCTIWMKSLHVLLPELFLYAHFCFKNSQFLNKFYPYSHHLQGGIKFITQISRLLNFYVSNCKTILPKLVWLSSFKFNRKYKYLLV